MRYWRLLGSVLLGAVLLGTMPVHGQAAPTTRSFYMGFTPFPYDISFEAVDFTYNTIRTDADLIAHSLDNGVPWVEALTDAPYNKHIMDDWTQRKNNTPTGHKVFVQINPLNWIKSGLANYRGKDDDMPLPSPWDTYTLDDPHVKTAYLNYCKQVIAFFKPDFLNISIEANLLMVNSPALWPAYVRLMQHVYPELKRSYPKLPIFISMTGVDLVEGLRPEVDHAAQLRALRDIQSFSDYFAISLYPYMSSYMTIMIPPELFEKLHALNIAAKPFVISETGYPGTGFELKSMGLNFPSDETRQDAYIALMLRKANEYDARFVVNFVLRDYDPLWEKIGKTDLAAVWKSTGLYTAGGIARKAQQTWKTTLNLPLRKNVP